MRLFSSVGLLVLTGCNGCQNTEDDGETGPVDTADADTDTDSDTDTDTDTDDSNGDTGVPVDEDGDGSPAGEGPDYDCDDTNAEVNPDAPELCDGIDNDCSGAIDDDALDATSWYADADRDGYGDGAARTISCEAPPGAVDNPLDCDDGDPAYNPDAIEDDCTDPADYNCDGNSGYLDADGDGSALCVDCDDGNPDLHPGATEICDPADVDEDCDGLVEEGDDSLDPASQILSYPDGDGDGFGDATVDGTLYCDIPTGAVSDNTDCDDGSAAYNPGATEICTDPNDYNCDGSVGYADGDGDGVAACEDCDDTDADVNPSANEVCNGVDDDCDTTVDVDASDEITWYTDGDGDNYGSGSSLSACDQPEGYAPTDDDCDDTDAAVNPAATERCNEVDDDCDDQIDEDVTTT